VIVDSKIREEKMTDADLPDEVVKIFPLNAPEKLILMI